MESFGAYLKSHREKKGIRIEEIASITKIHLHSLELLEASQWESLPPEPFIRGFVIAYAKYVGLEPKEVLERYFESTGRQRTPDPGVAIPVSGIGSGEMAPARPTPLSKSPPVPTPPAESRTGQMKVLPIQKILTAASVLFAVGVVSLLIYVGKRASEPAAPPVETAQQTTPAAVDPAASAPVDTRAVAASTTPASSTPAPAVAAVDPDKKHALTIEAKERSWIKVVIDEAAPVEQFIPAGEKATFAGKEKIKVVLGNSTGAKVLYNGQAVDGTKFMGTIRSYRYPANAKFPQDAPSKRTPSDESSSKPPEPTGDVPSPE